ncbi:MAG: APC family permease [Candidatus Thorarchaeota archaeon]|nr:MAG: APC family permease [Candidatus Thorarchaeota archaeon]
MSEVLFLRPTSGLTKYFGTWTSLFAILGASLGTWQWLFVGTLQDLYGPINAGATWGIGMVFMLLYTLMMTFLSMAMPRSSGLYQISGRGFNPVAGTIAVWRGIVANPIIKTTEFYLFLVFLGAAFSQWGAVTGNAAMTGLGGTLSMQEPVVLVVVSIALMVLFTIIAYLGPLLKMEPRIQMAGGVFSTIGWILALFVLVGTPAANVQGRWDTVWGAGAYTEVTTVAAAAGYVAPTAVSLELTLLATVWPIGLTWPYLILLYGGEVSDPAKNLVITQLGGGLILAGMLTAGAGLFQGVWGTFSSQYAMAAGAVTAGTQSFAVNSVFTSGLGTMTAVLTDNAFISGWILLSPVVIGLTATPINMAWVTRGFFQASLDRMMPSFFAKLSKYHTPTYSILYYLIFGAPFAIVYAAGYGALLGVITSLVGLWGIEMLFQSMAALQLPFLRRGLYEGSIRPQPEIAGYAVVSLLGVIILPVSLFLLIGFFQGAAFLSIISMCAQYGFSALWFVYFARRLEKQNIDMNAIYTSLTPE